MRIIDLTHTISANMPVYPGTEGPQLSAAKNAAAEASLRAVEQAMRACGGSSFYTKNELSRLWRDVVAGLFQPSDQEALHGAWANAVLGPVDPTVR